MKTVQLSADDRRAARLFNPRARCEACEIPYGPERLSRGGLCPPCAEIAARPDDETETP